ncbi:Protein Shisa-9 [Manis pentadactyla]|nr:Protein Shisa-9 [Manis pentadactyla]
MGHPHSYPSLGQISNPYDQQPPGKELNKYASLKMDVKHTSPLVSAIRMKHGYRCENPLYGSSKIQIRGDQKHWKGSFMKTTFPGYGNGLPTTNHILVVEIILKVTCTDSSLLRQQICARPALL